MSNAHWLFDLDGSLALYGKWKGAELIGEPLGVDDPSSAFNKVKLYLLQGRDVRIFTARVFPIGLSQEASGLTGMQYATRLYEAHQSKMAVDSWCLQYFGQVLPTQCWKTFSTIAIYDDRCVQVEKNTGKILGYEDADKPQFESIH